jgi:hypothetical protein
MHELADELSNSWQNNSFDRKDSEESKYAEQGAEPGQKKKNREEKVIFRDEKNQRNSDAKHRCENRTKKILQDIYVLNLEKKIKHKIKIKTKFNS